MPKRDFKKVSSSSIFIYTGSIWPVGNSLNIVAELQPWMLMFLSTCKRSHNVSFLVDTSNLKYQDDIKCDNKGSWKQNGTPKRLVRISTDNDVKLSIKAIKENPEHDTTQ